MSEELKPNESIVRWNATNKGIRFDDGTRSFTVPMTELKKMYRALEKSMGLDHSAHRI